MFASEIDESLSLLYEKNFGIKPFGDIKKIDIKNIPKHDVLCAGFPCQPFSKAGKMLGSKHYYGDLFEKIAEILEFHSPNYLLLENVSHLKKQGNSIIWNEIQLTLKSLGYNISDNIYSPHEFGIPQHRQRVYIVGSKKSLNNFEWVERKKNVTTNIKSILDLNPDDAKFLGKKENECLSVWQEFLDCIPNNISIPKFPIWAMEFGATYPIQDGKIPKKISEIELGEYKGIFGISLKGMNKENQFSLLPSHAINTSENFPHWKKRYIQQSRNFYNTHEIELKDVAKKIANLSVPSWQKLEWNVGNNEKKIRNNIIQFRASGVRVKNSETSPSLVCTNTQIPIIGWESRYITKSEGAKLQCIENIDLPENYSTCFKALGNAVNVEIVFLIAQALLNEDKIEKINSLKNEIHQHSLEFV